ncbi:hypothetical protein P154DRAFT_47426 [Amniculicola lignicola CBS 123094]|uniref:Uncharacterized protein n=1 Tax=Amniculicola lignicola CBS 123094 TaxID=1392246 RepID=A0A6A5W8M3_9PLEO|nr:hypothetical protein P154DRAFT_47426 [Amniculicola lignicola CBS 123094]
MHARVVAISYRFKLCSWYAAHTSKTLMPQTPSASFENATFPVIQDNPLCLTVFPRSQPKNLESETRQKHANSLLPFERLDIGRFIFLPLALQGDSTVGMLVLGKLPARESVSHFLIPSVFPVSDVRAHSIAHHDEVDGAPQRKEVRFNIRIKGTASTVSQHQTSSCLSKGGFFLPNSSMYLATVPFAARSK